MDDYGKQLCAAQTAIWQMHKDTSRLLMDLDTKLVEREFRPLNNARVTRDGTFAISGPWFASAVYRLYKSEQNVRSVLAINIGFYDVWVAPNIRFDEPLLIAAYLDYHDESGADEGAWDPWEMHLSWFGDRKTGVVKRMTAFAGKDSGRISFARFIAVPLYSIKKVEDVCALFDKVQEESAAAKA